MEALSKLAMSSLEAIIKWRGYLRNRLHRVLQRAGWNILNTPISMDNRQETPLDLVQKLDSAHWALCSSIERYALNLPEAEQQFRETTLLPTQSGPEAFSELFFARFLKIMEFIGSLSRQDCNKLMETNAFSSSVTVQWILEYGCFYEQSVIDEIILSIKLEHPEFSAPWAMSQFMRPVTPPDI